MRKFVAILLTICLMLGTLSLFAACRTPVGEEDKDYSGYKVLFLGDSIAEAIAGPSPVEGRADYGYYGIIGQINGYHYNNRAISGNQTGELLAYIRRPEEDAYITPTLIAEADVICISITGNDLLWHNFPLMLYELAAQEKYGEDYVNRPEVKDFYEYHRYQVILPDGTMRTRTPEDMEEGSTSRPLAPGDGLATFRSVVATATANVDAIVEELHSQNQHATIIFQNVYNPVDDESEIIPRYLVNDLLKLDAKYDFDTPEGVREYRRWGAYMLGAMSTILENVAKKNDKVEFLDVAKRFDEIYQADMARGKNLIFEDGVHPSDLGHSVIAAVMQQKLIELGFAEGKHSLENYKKLRKAQFDAMYKRIDGFDYAAACAAVDNATTMQDVGFAYFDAVTGFTPIISGDPVAGKPTNGVTVAETEVYELSRVISRRADEAGQQRIDGILDLADLLVQTKHVTLNTDGSLEMEIVLPLGDLLPLLSVANLNFDGTVLGGKEDTFYMDEAGNLTNLMMSGAKDAYTTIAIYADALFPGLGFTAGHFGSNFHLMFDSLGLGVDGLDVLFAQPYTDEVGLPLNMAPEGSIDPDTVGRTYESYADYVIAYLGRYQEVVDADGKTLHVDKLPAGITAKVQELGTVTVRLKTVYSLVEVAGQNDTTYHGIYCGPYDEKTTPWMIMTKYDDEEGNAHVRMNFEVLGLVIEF